MKNAFIGAVWGLISFAVILAFLWLLLLTKEQGGWAVISFLATFFMVAGGAIRYYGEK